MVMKLDLLISIARPAKSSTLSNNLCEESMPWSLR